MVSTRLTRELIAADARSDVERDDGAARTSRLLGAALSSLSVRAGTILRYEAAPRTPSCLASEGIAPGAIELLEGRSNGESLAQRACAERRLFVLDRTSREPLMPALRGAASELAIAAVIPLYDRGLPVATLVLASEDPRVLQASSLRLLTPAFHLLGVLLSPGRAGAGAVRSDEPGGALDQERYIVELEELGNLLHEARESARIAGEQAASSDAEHRTAVESTRSRISELEALASRAEVESSLRRDLESAYAAQGRRIEERERRIAELQAEVRRLQDEVAAGGAADGVGDGLGTGADIEIEIASDADGEDAGVLGAGDAGLDAIANAAAAALESAPGATDADGVEMLDSPAEVSDDTAVTAILDDAAEAVDGVDAEADGEFVVVAEEEGPSPVEADVPLALFGMDGDAEVREALRGAAARQGVEVWVGDDEPPANRGFLAVNLFDPLLERVGELVQAGRVEREGLAYGRDAESGTGLELGTVGWIARPIDTASVVPHVRSCVRQKAGGIVIISSHLRELSPLREALSAVGISSSVACDARQALDLLDIVRNTHAILVDLALDGGQGLSIAIQCRTQNETRDTPLMLLLASQTDPARLLAGARRTGVLSPFGADDVARMVTATLSQR